MAYDPKDPADRALVDAEIADALEEQREEHETAVEGLKTKNRELLAKLKKAREGGDNAEVARLEAEVERLEGELSTATASLKATTKELDKITKERDTATTDLTNERTTARDLLVNSGLTAELTGVKVADGLLSGALNLLKGKVEVREVDGERKLFVGDKSLGDYVKEWSLGDEGKSYVAFGNGGGGSNQNKPQGGPSDKPFGEMNSVERKALFDSNPARFEELAAAHKEEVRKAAMGG